MSTAPMSCLSLATSDRPRRVLWRSWMSGSEARPLVDAVLVEVLASRLCHIVSEGDHHLV